MSKAILKRDDPMNTKKVSQLENSHWARAKGDTALITIVDERKATRSLAQNKLYWAWLRILSDYTGYANLEELRLLLQLEFLGYEFDFKNQRGNKHIQQVKGTSKLTVKAFREYLQKVEEYSLNTLDCKLPNEDDLYWQAMGVTD